jgi:hypothetical protein
VYEACPKVKMVHRLKECLRHIFESDSTKQKALKRLGKWCRIAEQEELFESFRQTLTNWIDKIANYFHRRTTNCEINYDYKPVILRKAKDLFSEMSSSLKFVSFRMT